jgi:hypothetical protein
MIQESLDWISRDEMLRVCKAFGITTSQNRKDKIKTLLMNKIKRM